MTSPHPKLCFRPRRAPGLQRPKLSHPILGTLELVNRNGIWWQGTTTIAGSIVRMDVQRGTDISELELFVAADLLQWVQHNEPIIRLHIAKQLVAGDFKLNLRKSSTANPRIADAAFLHGIRPYMIVLSADSADLFYQCDSLPEGNLLGAHTVEVSVDRNKSPQSVSLFEEDFCRRANRLFERQLPPDATDFEDSIADQLIAKAAEKGKLQLSVELTSLLKKEIESAESRIRSGSPECSAYMISVKQLLLEIAKTPRTMIERIFVTLRLRHPAGKRIPIKQRLIFSPTDRAKIDGSGFPSVQFPTVSADSFAAAPEPSEAFESAFQDRLKEAATWLAKQPSAVFHDLREAGFVTEMFIYCQARIESEKVDLNLPPDFLVECGRLGLTVAIGTINSGSDKPHD